MTLIIDTITFLYNFAIENPLDTLEVVLMLILVVMVIDSLRMIWYLSINKYLGINSHPFSKKGVAGGKRILILGDSTAVGTGADKPEDSIAGQLARDFPTATIVNPAQKGGLTRDILTQLKTSLGIHVSATDAITEDVVAELKGAANTTPYDLIIVCTGGNDIWHFTPLWMVRRDLKAVLREAKQMTKNGNVIVLLYSNLGIAPLFSMLVRMILTRRTKKIQELFREVTKEENVACIELFTKSMLKSENPFMDDPKKYYARDQIHPSSEGYRIWYHRMWLILSKIKIIT